MTPLQERAIPEAFWEDVWGRRYVRFEQGDWQAFKDADHTHLAGWMKRRIVEKAGGYVIHRWDLKGGRLPSYVRPDVPVSTSDYKKPTKYIQASKRATGQSAKLLDVHPLVRDQLVKNVDEPIYFCIEGCLKADAVAGSERLAIAVSSVTLWDADDEILEPWLPVLRAAPIVYVIPDSDYGLKRRGSSGQKPIFINRNVRYQTDKCVRSLRRQRGVNAHYLVPPYLSWEEAKKRRVSRWKVGIDDHLAHGGNWEQWSPDNVLGVHTWVYRRRDFRRPARSRDNTFLDWLEDTHGPVGAFAMEDAAEDLCWNRTTVWRAKESCIQRKVLSVWDGKPLGPGKGNGRHVFRFEIHEEL
jgi:hypothetical protein